MTKSKKWTYRHRVSFANTLSHQQYYHVLSYCYETFGRDKRGNILRDRWDVSSVRRRIHPRYWSIVNRYDRVKLHFKYQQDQVQFKLCYSLPTV